VSPLLYNVTDIKFDFNDDLDEIYSIPKSDQELIIREHLGVWEADDHDDLIEEIACNSGWLIEFLDYEIQLK
jgi:hypothetical protein